MKCPFYAAFNLGLQKTFTAFEDYDYIIYVLQPIKIQNRLFHYYCINMYGIIHQNEED